MQSANTANAAERRAGMGTQPGHDERRLPHVDAMRGLAVLCMLCMHTGDGWISGEFRDGEAWELVRALGGLAAPSFLLLAGVSLGIARVRGADDWRREGARAGQLILLGYLLRVQMWMVDGAGYASASGWLGGLLLAGGYLGGFVVLERWGRSDALPTGYGLLPGLSVMLGLFWVAWQHTSRLPGLLREDILQAIGACLLVTGWLTRRVGPLGAVGLALVIGLSTEAMRGLMPGPLPEALAGYVAGWRAPPGSLPAGLFPLFPWLAYPLVGYGVGRALGRGQRADAEEVSLVLSAAGALLALSTCELFAPVKELMREMPWTVQPLRVTYRVGVGLVLGGLSVGLSRGWLPLRSPLLLLGRASLCVYWVHLMFAYGVLSRPLHRTLSPGGWAVGLGVLTAAMVGVAIVWLQRRRLGALGLRLLGPRLPNFLRGNRLFPGANGQDQG